MVKNEIQIVGSFATEYSLAKVNRELAVNLAELQKDYKVSIWADESIADRLPKPSDYEKYPEIKELFNPERRHTSVAIYNDFPKSFPSNFGLNKLDADIRIAYLAWEESIFPKKMVDECNKYLHGMVVTTEHVRKVFRNSGIKLPMIIAPPGLNHELLEKSQPYHLKTKKRFKFLHLSSGLPRKGVDVLLKAYFQEFSIKDDVVLIIKTYRNPDNKIDEIINSLATPDSPEVEVIYDLDLRINQVAWLYEQVDCVVAPSRAEGFGMPMAEALLKKVPLITTEYSGQLDFCDNENTFFIGYELQPSKSQLPIIGAHWAEPNADDLRKRMRDIFEDPDSEEVKSKIVSGFQTASNLSWENTAKKIYNFVEDLQKVQQLKQMKLAIITTLNSRCGIAEYSKNLYPLVESSFKEIRYLANKDVGDRVDEDAENVVRTWEYGEETFNETLKALEEYDPEYVHIQYNLPFYGLHMLARLVERVAEKRNVFITLHSVRFDYVDFGKHVKELAKAKQIYVHSHADLEFLNDKGFNNVVYFEHGIPNFSDEDKQRLRMKLGLTSNHIVASHGLIHEKKGLLQTIRAVAELKKTYPDVLFISVNATNPNNISSAATAAKMSKLVNELELDSNVLLIDNFLEINEIIKLLHLSDIVILPYDDLAEGASGAVRTALSAQRLLITSDSDIFRELPVGIKINGNAPETIAQAILNIYSNPEVQSKELSNIRKYVALNSWETMSQVMLQSYTNLS